MHSGRVSEKHQESSQQDLGCGEVEQNCALKADGALVQEHTPQPEMAAPAADQCAGGSAQVANPQTCSHKQGAEAEAISSADAKRLARLAQADRQRVAAAERRAQRLAQAAQNKPTDEVSQVRETVAIHNPVEDVETCQKRHTAETSTEAGQELEQELEVNPSTEENQLSRTEGTEHQKEPIVQQPMISEGFQMASDIDAKRAARLKKAAELGAEVRRNQDRARKAAVNKQGSADLQISILGLPPPVTAAYHRLGMTHLYEWQRDCLNCVKGVCMISERLPILSRVQGPSLYYTQHLPEVAKPWLLRYLSSQFFSECKSEPCWEWQVLMLRRVLQHKAFALFIVPYVSIVSEKASHFTRICKGTNVSEVSASTACAERGVMQITVLEMHGNSKTWQLPSKLRATIIVCTAEKAGTIVNRLVKRGSLEDELCSVVVDELHMLSDGSRG